MSDLFRRLNIDLVEYPLSHLVMLIEGGLLCAEDRKRLHDNAHISLHSLLPQPEFDNLREHGPTLVAWQACSGDGLAALSPLYGMGQHQLRDVLCGWLVSACPPESLAKHLAQANRIIAPDGDAYLFRYHAAAALHTLSDRNDAWAQAFFSPLVTWWWRTPSPQDQRAAWRGHRGHARPQPEALPPLRPDDHLWRALVGGDRESYALLHNLERLTPAPFATECPGERLSKVTHLLEQARAHGLKRKLDRADYVLWCLTNPSPPERLPHWPNALSAAQAGRAWLIDSLVGN